MKERQRAAAPNKHADGDAGDGDGDGDDDAAAAADDDDGATIGPAMPSAAEAEGAGGASGGGAWWQREASAPKARAAAAEEEGGAGERDSWMTALPTDKTFLSGVGAQMQGRTFLRQGVNAQATDSSWTEAPQREGNAPAAAAAGRAVPMSLAEAAKLAAATAASGGARRAPPAVKGGGGGGGSSSGGGGEAKRPKSLVEIHAEAAAAAKKKESGGAAKAEWQGAHPWRPWNRETDLDVRRVDPKGQEKIVKHDILGTIGDRFGASKRETTFM